MLVGSGNRQGKARAAEAQELPVDAGIAHFLWKPMICSSGTNLSSPPFIEAPCSFDAFAAIVGRQIAMPPAIRALRAASAPPPPKFNRNPTDDYPAAAFGEMRLDIAPRARALTRRALPRDQHMTLSQHWPCSRCLGLAGQCYRYRRVQHITLLAIVLALSTLSR